MQGFSSKFVYLTEEILNLNVKNNKPVQLDDNLSLTTKKISHLCRAHLKDNRWRSPGGSTTTSSHHMIAQHLKNNRLRSPGEQTTKKIERITPLHDSTTPLIHQETHHSSQST